MKGEREKDREREIERERGERGRGGDRITEGETEPAANCTLYDGIQFAKRKENKKIKMK